MLQDALSVIRSIIGLAATLVVLLNEPPEGEIYINYELHTPDFTSDFILQSEVAYTYKPNDEVKIFCHDSENLDNITWYDYMIEEYNKRGDFTVITANYTTIFKNVTVDNALRYTKPLGEALGDYIIRLKELGVPFEKIHVIGHRLGAHIAGVAGERVYELTGENVGRITGLDPTIVGFFQLIIDGRLSRDDAKFVDVIYASHYMADLQVEYISMGRVNFYPAFLNYICSDDVLGNTTDIAPRLYSLTIAPKNSKMFKLEKCQSDYNCKKPFVAYMGEYTNRNALGSFYFMGSNVPICKKLNIPLVSNDSDE